MPHSFSQKDGGKGMAAPRGSYRGATLGMNMSTIRKASRMRAAIIGTLACTSGCVGYKVEEVDYGSPQKAATVVVSDPQVYARASLINDRRREVEYLQQLLTNSTVDSSGQSKVNFSPQIIRDLRTVQALSANLSLAVGKGSSQETTQATVENQIAVTKLQAQLAVLQKQVEGIQTAATPSVTIPSLDLSSATSLSAAQSGTTPTPLMPDVSALQSSIKTIQSQLTALTNVGSASDPNNNYAALEDARSDFIDRQAYRRDIRAAIAEAQLDDVHDRAGNALFRLQFQATVLPPNGASKQWAATKMRVSPPALSATDIADAYYRWIGYLTGQLSNGIPADSDQGPDTLVSHSYAYDLHVADIGQGGYFNVLDIVQNQFNEQFYCLVHTTGTTKQLQQLNVASERAKVRELQLYYRLGTFAVSPVLIPIDACENYPSGAAPYVFDRPLSSATVIFAVGVTTQFLPSSTRGQLLKNFPATGPNRPSSVAEPTRVEPDRIGSVPAFFCKAVVDPTSADKCGTGGLSRFAGTIPAAAGQPTPDRTVPVSETSAVRSYSVLPTELAQRLGVTTESSQSLQTAMTVAAQLSAAAKAGLDVGYLSQMDARAEALTREPIVVGFAGTESVGACSGTATSPCSGASYFGWLFGPTFEVKDSKTLTLKQTVRSYGVNADISVPGWWNYLILNMSSAWVQNWNGGGVIQGKNGDQQPLVPLARRVNLPLSDATYVSLTDFIAARQYGPSDTHLYISGVTPDLVPACASTVTFNISGGNIWRANSIYFGGAPASAISVLPDMQGIAATFDMTTVYGSIVNTDSSIQTIPLTVSAQQGSDVWRWITVVGKRQSSSGATTCQSPVFLPSMASEVATAIVAYSPSDICSDAQGTPLVVQGLNLPDAIDVHSALFDGKGWAGDSNRRVTDLTLKKGAKLTPGGSITVAIADSAATNSKGTFPLSIAVKDCEAMSKATAGGQAQAVSPSGAVSTAKATLQSTTVQLTKDQKITLKLTVPTNYAAIAVEIRPQSKNNLKWTPSTAASVTPGTPGVVTGTFDLSAFQASIGDKLDVQVTIEANPQVEPIAIAADKEVTIEKTVSPTTPNSSNTSVIGGTVATPATHSGATAPKHPGK
jgi:hypothetical protein